MSSRALPAGTRDGAPTWESPREWARCVSHRPYLVRTTTTALAVGTLVFCINHLATVLEGDATTGMWLATGFTYLVPFCVSNLGLLAGRRRPESRC